MRTLLIVAITSLAFIGTALAGPIHDAAKAGDVAKVRQLLANGAKVDAREEDGWTPLHWAAVEGHADVAKVLLAAGADGSLKDGDGKTPFDKAKSDGRLEDKDLDTHWLLSDARYK
jgi:ankyrin repeat protein